VKSLGDPMNMTLRRSMYMSTINYDGAEKLVYVYTWIYKASVIAERIYAFGGD
jgi:hypothetical protein